MARETRETWIKRIERWVESGLTAKEFADETGVNAATLSHWKYRLAAEERSAAHRAADRPQEAVSFVEVTATTETTTPAQSAPPSTFEVVLADGAIIRVPPHFDAAALRRLLDVVTTR